MSLFNSAFGNFKEKFRKIEKLSRKCVNLQGAIVFNRTCLNNGLYPKFAHIYIYIYIWALFLHVDYICLTLFMSKKLSKNKFYNEFTMHIPLSRLNSDVYKFDLLNFKNYIF